MNKKIWLSSPHMGGTEMKYVQEAYDINWVAPLGPNVNGLEEDLENYLGNHDFAKLSVRFRLSHINVFGERRL